MSTSLKVVSIAAVFCASLSRRAMVWRSLVRRTRSSRAASSGAEGARAATGAGAAAGVGATGVGGRAPPALGERLERVALENLAALAAACDAGEIEPAARWRSWPPTGAGGHRRSARRPSAAGVRPRARRRGAGGGGAGGGREAAKKRADRHRLPGLGGDLAQHARRGRVALPASPCRSPTRPAARPPSPRRRAA